MPKEFPYLGEHEYYLFPPVSEAGIEGILAVGGNLSPGMLISAYRQGVFPWYSPGEPILWWSPNPRFVLFPDDFHVSRSLRKSVRRSGFTVTFDTAFDAVVAECGATPRPGQRGTWITDEIMEGYGRLHRLGYAHSVEIRLSDVLVGGIYGVSLGACFYGESMFSHVTDASKVGFVYLMEFLISNGCRLIDCQVYTEHLASFGADEIPRSRFLSLLAEALKAPDLPGTWHALVPTDLATLKIRA